MINTFAHHGHGHMQRPCDFSLRDMMAIKTET
jgi:hypothetical protein